MQAAASAATDPVACTGGLSRLGERGATAAQCVQDDQADGDRKAPGAHGRGSARPRSQVHRVGQRAGRGLHRRWKAPWGSTQAVYAFQREDLDLWAERLGRDLPNGFFGENLTTVGIDVNEARLGERWRVGSEVVLQVTTPRTPCATFRGWMGEKAWARLFTQEARPGAYLSVVVPGQISAGDAIEVIHRPEHEITLAMSFRALTRERDLLPRLLEAGDDLDPELRQAAVSKTLTTLD